MPFQFFSFEDAKKRFNHGIIPAVSLMGHALNPLQRVNFIYDFLARKLSSLITMEKNRFCRKIVAYLIDDVCNQPLRVWLILGRRTNKSFSRCTGSFCAKERPKQSLMFQGCLGQALKGNIPKCLCLFF